MKIIEQIAAERERQKKAEGWTQTHDDHHTDRELARAAACYANPMRLDPHDYAPAGWPWSYSWWKPKSYRRNLIRAAALIVAEIERIDRRRASKRKTGGS